MAKPESQQTIAEGTEGLLRWMEPQEFRTLCFQSTEIRDVLRNAKIVEVDDLVDVLTTMFEEEYLVMVIDRFEEVKYRFAEYLLANAVTIAKSQGVALKKIKWSEGSPGKKYRWLCRDCGENRGIHFYPIQCCCSCGGQNLVRQVTKSSLGYTYRR